MHLNRMVLLNRTVPLQCMLLNLMVLLNPMALPPCTVVHLIPKILDVDEDLHLVINAVVPDLALPVRKNQLRKNKLKRNLRSIQKSKLIKKKILMLMFQLTTKSPMLPINHQQILPSRPPLRLFQVPMSTK